MSQLCLECLCFESSYVSCYNKDDVNSRTGSYHPRIDHKNRFFDVKFATLAGLQGYNTKS